MSAKVLHSLEIQDQASWEYKKTKAYKRQLEFVHRLQWTLNKAFFYTLFSFLMCDR